jgi:Flp pilus assembly protein TadD
MKPAKLHRGPLPTIEAAKRAFGAGDLGATELICAQRLARDANDWTAWSLLAETALQRGRPDAALVCAERATVLSNGKPIPFILRSKCLFLTGNLRQALEAAELAEACVGMAPEEIDALGAIFGLLGLHDRARGLFLRAVASRTDTPQYLFNLAATERMTGALEEAEAHCDAALNLDRYYGLAHYLRSDLRIQTADRNHIAEMEAAISEGKLSPQSEIMVRFALGKECDDLELYERAFDHVDTGCMLQRKLIGESRDGAAELEQVIRSHTRNWIDAAPAGHSSGAPVFVTGLPRTGTTLVERILASHPAMNSVGETGAFAAELRRATIKGDGRADPARLGQNYLDSATALRLPPDARFVDKTLENYLYCGLIHASLPAAKMILVRRRPMDACWAMYKAHFHNKFAFSYDQIEVAEYYLAFRRLSEHWRAVLPKDALLEINYEDIVNDQEAASRKMIDFVGLAWDDDVLRFDESLAPWATASAVQVRRPIYASSIGKWRRYAERLTPLRDRLLRDIPEADLA